MIGPHPREPAAWPAALVAGLVLATIYAFSVAPDVTFWDAGEFLSAFATFGIPHPPGTPLFVAIGRVWTLAGTALGLPRALVGNLLSAACTAVAGACTAWLVARWTRSRICAVAAALCAGTMSTVWANATEAEVYAASLALACVALVFGERAGAHLADSDDRRSAFGGRGRRETVATAYALALAVPLHLSALVVGPAAIWLACAAPRATFTDTWRAVDRRRAGGLTSAAVLIAGVGQARASLIATGIVGLSVFALAPDRRAGTTAGTLRATRAELRAVAGAVVVALSATLVLLVRARHDPMLNQGDPSTWARLIDVVARHQYAVADLWPRQAPWWLQLANLGEWADWQFALGLAPDVGPTPARTPVTIAFAILAVVGSTFHYRRDPRSWTALLLLFVAGSVGVALTLNLKAGPSFGVGVLAASAPHEARERDYFFVLAWWAWGVWAGIGAVVIARRLTLGRAPRTMILASAVAAGVAAAPAALNWRASSRARPPSAFAAGTYARVLLENAPARAVLVVNGDNDTYPVWHAQLARATRRDVTVVTASLLPARWYRAELARRADLLGAREVAQWLGPTATLAAIAARARQHDRPVAIDLATDDATRRAVALDNGVWRLRGLTLEWTHVALTDGHPAASTPGDLTLAPTIAAMVGATAGDRPAIEHAAASAPRIAADLLTDTTGDGVVAWAYRQLACPHAALVRRDASASAAPRRSLEGACRAR